MRKVVPLEDHLSPNVLGDGNEGLGRTIYGDLWNFIDNSRQKLSKVILFSIRRYPL